MKKLLFCLMALSALVLSGCEDNGDGATNQFSGTWAITVEYDNESGIEYYSECDQIIKVNDNSIRFYESVDWDGYSFEDGYLDCSEDDFDFLLSIPYEKKGSKGYFSTLISGEMEIKNGQLYVYNYDADAEGYYAICERVKGFLKD